MKNHSMTSSFSFSPILAIDSSHNLKKNKKKAIDSSQYLTAVFDFFLI